MSNRVAEFVRSLLVRIALVVIITMVVKLITGDEIITGKSQTLLWILIFSGFSLGVTIRQYWGKKK